jgi:hypothetical protein
MMDFNLGAHLTNGIRAAGWQHLDLWIAALATGADLELRDVTAIATGRQQPTHAQYETLAAALNERIGALGGDHPIRSWRQLPDR